MPLLESIIRQAIAEAKPDFGVDDVAALAAARIEARFFLIDRQNVKDLKQHVYLQGAFNGDSPTAKTSGAASLGPQSPGS